MTQNSPGLSRRRARAAQPTAARIAPSVRPLADGDFFAWVEMYAAYLEQLGEEYRDDRALRAWRQFGLGPGTNAPLPGVEAIVAERSGNLVGFAISQPTVSVIDGSRRLDVPAFYIERLDHDGRALEALLEALHARAVAEQATQLRWQVPEDAVELRRRLERLGAGSEQWVYEMPVQL